MSCPSRGGRGSKRDRNKGDGWDEAGGYMAAKIQKLENQFGDQKKDASIKSLSNIFENISIFVNGYTRPTSDVLKKMMQQHGGQYHHYYSRAKVTHIIASNLPNSKVSNLTDKKVVHPDWITESIKANKLLPYQDFLLYKAETKRQPSIKFARETKQGQTEEDAKDSNTTKESAMSNASDTTSNIISVAKGGQNNLMSENTAERSRHSADGQNAEKKLSSPKQDISSKSPPLQFTSPGSSSRKAGDPNFVSEFYGHSRLHHISQWGAEMKAYVKTLQATPSDFPARHKLVKIVEEDLACQKHDMGGASTGRVIMHIDMDSFFVSVGIRTRPELIGKPIAVTHNKGSNKTSKDAEACGFRGSMAEIASCSYEARQKGVKNGMFLGGAREVCPDIVCIPYDFQGYSDVSHQLYDLVASYTHDIEAVSCDEMFVNLTELLADTGASPLQFVTLLRSEIKEATKCNASAGVGGNMLLARLATTKAKPNGQHYVRPEEAEDFMASMTVRTLPGVGRKLSNKLLEMGVGTCSDLQQLSLPHLQKEVGNKTGQMLYNYCRGKDDRVIQTEKARKSVSAEINYGIRFTKDEEAEKFIGELSEEVSKRLHAIDARGKTITLKLKVRAKDAPVESAKFLGHGICDSYAKSVTLLSVTDNVSVIAKECNTLLLSLHVPASDIRGMGIQISRLDTESSTAQQGVRSILQFTTKLTKPAAAVPIEEEKKTDSPIKVPEPRPRELPPLPSLDLSSQQLPLLHFDVTQNSADRQHQQVKDMTKGVQQIAQADNYWLNSSQIDEKTLAELPADIQAEIRRQMSAQVRRKQVSDRELVQSEDNPDLHTSQEAGCSHWMSGKEHRRKSSHSRTSDIDEDIMAELPADIQAEIRQQMAVQKVKRRLEDRALASGEDGYKQDVVENLEEGCSNWVPLISNRRSPSPSVITMPVLKQAPTTPKKGRSPRKQSGRGRGRPRKTQGITQKSPLKNPVVATHDERPRMPDVNDIKETEIEPVTEREPEAVSLCGAVTLCDVKLLLHQWLEDSSEPCEEDVERFLEYSSALVHTHNMEQLLFVLRHLRRLASRRNEMWVSTAERITKQAQTIVQSIYGSLLKV